MAKQQDQTQTMKWIDLSTYKARLSFSEKDGRRFLVILGISADDHLGWKLRNELGFKPSGDGDWLIRDDLKLSSTMLRTVLSEATVKSMDVDQVRIPLDDVRSAHEALVGGR
ncbi:hypothetical protein, partial [Trinickia sp. EG282A]|uniref:hypothetical protein n=1 Tax=Trinickia sp. EG282A TaxID=3237013 RepID=UPI0034D25CB2